MKRILVVVLGAAVLLGASACNSGQSVDDVAHELTTTRYNAATLSARLEAVNGSGTIDSDVADAMTASEAVDELLEMSPEAAERTCFTWEKGGLEDATDEVLAMLRGETDGNDTKAEAISMICKLLNIGNGA